MPNGKPNPQCTDCRGTGVITLLTSSGPCDCVKIPHKNPNKTLDYKYDLKNIDFKKSVLHPSLYKIDYLNCPKKIIMPEGITGDSKRLYMSSDDITQGILTRHMWPGIEGYTCKCGITMNVLGMSCHCKCPVCGIIRDDGFRHLYLHHMTQKGPEPHNTPDYGPSKKTIEHGYRIARDKRLCLR